MEWISVKDRLPEAEQEVLLSCETRPNKFTYICKGFYIPDKWLRENSTFDWDLECCNEYCEELDDYYLNEGWYERIHNWGEYSSVGIADFVTYWMPLPEPPNI